ncbi:M23 family metallopeptidase [Leptospira sp. GIMC2001]|uniref:M23 family metallopeptidase n=1 Tax=Leptospira sp. GIMC2001 TaxID=1513297 RepID=UPI00234AC560|nr:M23 family metallopeptidase [Leptospira sp. GIMC2001]WCL49396.1 M23 family metallopeptidase [Leptospira sp. GIMC2001]
MKARNFAQGEVIYVSIKSLKPGVFSEKFKMLADNKPVLLSPKSNTEEMIGFIPISPEYKNKTLQIEIQSKILFVKYGTKKYEIDIHTTDFLVIKKQSITLDKKYTEKKYSDEVLKFIQECSAAKNTAFSSMSDLQFTSGFVMPVKKVYLTSPFYVRRDYNKTKGKPHGGLDFRGSSGTPIFAIQDGTVVLAREMYFEGNFTIIDHGNKIFSFYMHQSSIAVKPGDKVKKGQEIGKIGSTGMSTGPHLHLGIKVNDVILDPMSILSFKNL